MTVINPGVDLNDYASKDKKLCRAEISEEYRFSPDEPIILFVSMNFEIKGLDAIILALARLKAQNRNFKFLIAGKGNTVKYAKMARQVGITNEVRFTGQVNREKLIKMYLADDMYIMLSKFDTFGMVVLEAMAVGLPVIISGNVGARDLIREGENGFVVNNTSDADYIAAKINVLLDENIRRAMAEAAYQTAAQNTWSQVAAKHQEIYTGIIAAKKSA